MGDQSPVVSIPSKKAGHPRPIILFKGKDKAGCYVSNLRMGMNLSLFLLYPPVLKQTKA